MTEGMTEINMDYFHDGNEEKKMTKKVMTEILTEIIRNKVKKSAVG